MVHGIYETLCRERLTLRLNVVLQRKHVRDRNLPARFEYVINPCRAPRRLPLGADRVGKSIRRYASVRGPDDARWRVVNVWQFLERNVICPLVRVIRATHRQTAVAGCTDRDSPGRLIADISLNVCVDNVLSGSIKLGESPAEDLPVLSRVHIEKGHPQTIVESPS